MNGEHACCDSLRTSVGSGLPDLVQVDPKLGIALEVLNAMLPAQADTFDFACIGTAWPLPCCRLAVSLLLRSETASRCK